MRTSLKVTIVVTLIVFALALPVIVLFIYPQSYVGIATRLIHSSSGYEVELSGIEVDSFPLKLVLSDLRVINPSIDSVDPVLTVNQFDASARLWGYIRGDTNWWLAAASGIMVRYAVDERGQNNWTLNPESEPSSIADDSRENPGSSVDGGNDLLLSLDSLSVADFEFIHSIEGRTERLQIANLTLNKNQDKSVNVSLQGSYQDKPLTLSGLLPLPNSDQAREVDIDASLFGSNWKIAGQVGHNGITPANVDISIQASDLSALTALTNIDFSPFTPINLNGTVVAPSLTQWISSLTGQFGEQNLELDGSLTLDESSYILEEFVLNTGFVTMTGVGRIDPDAHKVAAELDIGRLDVDQLLAFLNLPLQTRAEPNPEPVASEPAESEENGEADPVAALRDQLASAAEILNPWSVDIHGQLDNLIISGNQLSGLTLDATTEGAKLQVAAQLQSVHAVQTSQSQPSDFQTFLPLRISAEILIEPERVQMRDLELNINGDDVQGELFADLTQERLNLAGDLKIDRLNVEQILSTLNQDPEKEELTQTSSSDSELSTTEKTEETERVNALRVQLLSAIEVLNSLSLDIQTQINTVEVSGVLLSGLSANAVSDGAKLEISAALKNVASVSESESADDGQSEFRSLESVLPLEVSAELLIEPERVAMNVLNMNMGGDTAQGQLLADLSGEVVHLEAELNILFEQLNVDQLLSALDNIQQPDLDSNVSANSGQTETIETAPITALKSQLVSVVEILNRLSLDVHGEFDSLVVSGYQLTNFKADAKSDGANLELSAALENLILSEDSGPVPANGSKYQQNDFQAILPLTFAAEVSIEPERVVINELDINMDGDTLQGELVADLSGKMLSLDGQLSADRIDLDRFTTTSEENLKLEGTGTTIDEDNKAEDNQDVIGDQAIDWSWLNAANLRLDITSDLVRVNSTDYRNLVIELSMQDRTLIVDPISADLTQGGIRGNIKIEPLESGAAIAANIIATELTPADLGQPDKGLIDGGETDLVIKLTTRGTTAQELASALNGEIALEVQHATVRNNLFEMIGSDVLTQFLDLINPFAKNDGQTELQCAAIHFVAEDGILTSQDKLAIETSKMVIRGGGKINLNDETLQIDFVPSARSGLGIGLGRLASVVRLGGTLGNPSPEVAPIGILRSGADIGAAISTGGLSLLAQGLFDRARNTMTSCGRIFEENTELPAVLESSGAFAPGTNTPDPR